MSELEELIAEQERDAKSFRVFSVSHDAWPSGPDLVYRYSRKLATDPRHGTNSCYTGLGCRCDKCRAAAAEQKRSERRRKAKPKRAFTYVLTCQDCGSHSIERKRVYQTERNPCCSN